MPSVAFLSRKVIKVLFYYGIDFVIYHNIMDYLLYKFKVKHFSSSKSIFNPQIAYLYLQNWFSAYQFENYTNWILWIIWMPNI